MMKHLNKTKICIMNKWTEKQGFWNERTKARPFPPLELALAIL